MPNIWVFGNIWTKAALSEYDKFLLEDYGILAYQGPDFEVEDKLKSWMNNTPVYLQLQWFDTVEEVKISSELRSKRWNTEVTERDRLYLTKLGMNPS